MPDDISDSEYALIFAGKRWGLPLLANAGADTVREERLGVPLRRVAYQVACAIKAVHDAAAAHPETRPLYLPAFRRMVLAYVGLFNMAGAATDSRLPRRLLCEPRADLLRWLRAVALEGDVLGTAALEPRRSARRR